METVIQVKNVSKQYKITHWQGGYITLRDSISNVFRHPLRFFKKKAANIISGESREDFWALRGLNFSVQKGEVIGIIGANGAGKSTLLKILTKITPPSEGEITLQGKVSSLLEVGTGFHPELTGRENIFFYGAILGMKKREIVEKFDQIVEFAGMQKFLDTPVKKYSSGMYVRLAFSVAAHMEPDILLIDEVLAVGDAEFQKKCLEKMRSVARDENRTILFISHNMNAVRSLCNRCVLLEKGEVKMIGDTDAVINRYLKHRSSEFGKAVFEYPADVTKPIAIRKIKLLRDDNTPAAILEAGIPFAITIEYEVNQIVSSSRIFISCANEEGVEVFVSCDTDKHPELFSLREPGSYRATFRFPANDTISLSAGDYFLRVRVTSDPQADYLIPLSMDNTAKRFVELPGVLLLGPKWELEKI
ncbi:MAG: ABC transporter related protein [Parcubacteria group bacterium GW2011_GWA1_47_10]|uniref:ABC transporter related protein n=1 Tax=Candidatus Nomurabacteria bacterium GW2011_GWB1_47_6 TaxID=1618749 RepID=A0A0G1VZN9_9BACT|nr:MAG: ABC transporter related protein [Parcubacteria group bacterium GW2011_GWA1_47_10]KKU75535.1 MAG: ABC transporter related protein [Candidatus Nomurabacteria bacterium GW2011_GWB1_47_6]OHA39445.1 MAG: hypothetical protein A3I98_02700 [Candidatus Taylorbacteria bacterium RIFCSPLOWO2_02_FULL_45_10b]HXK35920.1 ABC transporter ATP-binding protein [Candidatus Paceibacterota bacterium]